MRDIIRKFSEQALLKEMNERVADGLRQWEREVVEEHFPPKGRLLNVGCGCGREAMALAKMGYEVFALDVTAKQLAQAKENARREGLRITFAETDGVSVPFGRTRFDVIILWTQVLGNIASRADRLRLLESCRGSLSPGGLVTASVHEREFCREDTPESTDERWLYPWGRGQLRYELFTKVSLDELFSDAGFRTIVTEVPASLRAIIYTVARRAQDS
jgi:2-polyprenyl-3-methyl-5-hydroxy-6-metoxy-1,4-benzoquinol methylase